MKPKAVSGTLAAMKRYRLTTTLALLRECGSCWAGFRRLLKSLGPQWPEDRPINLLRALEYNGVQDILWALQATEQPCERVARLMAADLAESVLEHFTKERPDDNRPALAIKAARDFANGKIDAATLDAARKAAADAAGTATGIAGAAALDASSVAALDPVIAFAVDAEPQTQSAIVRKWLR